MPSRGSPNSALHTLHTLSTAHRTGRDRPEQVVVIDRNGWSSSIGTPGRHHPVRALDEALVDSFETWLRGERKKLSSKGPLAKAIDYTFNHWQAFTRFLDDGRICLFNKRPSARCAV